MGKRLKYDDTHKIIDDILYKLCNICENWFPCTRNYFYYNETNSIDGLYSFCIECCKKKSAHWINNNREDYRASARKNSRLAYRRELRKTLSREDRANGKRKMWEEKNKSKLEKYRIDRKYKQHDITKKEWDACKNYFDYCCAYCELPLKQHYKNYRGKSKKCDFHKEHVDDDGSNDLSNCVPSCHICNSSKRKYDLDEWFKRQEFFNEKRLDKIIKWITEDYKYYKKGKKINE